METHSSLLAWSWLVFFCSVNCQTPLSLPFSFSLRLFCYAALPLIPRCVRRLHAGELVGAQEVNGDREATGCAALFFFSFFFLADLQFANCRGPWGHLTVASSLFCVKYRRCEWGLGTSKLSSPDNAGNGGEQNQLRGGSFRSSAPFFLVSAAGTPCCPWESCLGITRAEDQGIRLSGSGATRQTISRWVGKGEHCCVVWVRRWRSVSLKLRDTSFAFCVCTAPQSTDQVMQIKHRC